MSSSIVDAARRLASPLEPTYFDDLQPSLCSFCESSEGEWSGEQCASPWYITHRSGCPILAMPKILAALEAAESLASTFDNMDTAMFEIWDGLKALRAALGAS